MPVLGDINGDGMDEIVLVESSTILHVFNILGEDIEGWPKNIEDNSMSSPALHDLNHDGKLEIIIPSGNNLVVFNSQGEIMWSKPLQQKPHMSSPSVGDIDADGRAEIVLAGSTMSLYPEDCFVYVFEDNGDIKQGWPQTIHDCMVGILASPSIGDINADGKNEIIINKLLNSEIFVFESSGENLPGWPQRFSNLIYSAPVIADIDDDGKKEIIEILSGQTYFGIPHYLLILEENGRVKYYKGPINLDSPTSVLIDNLDEDPEFELVYQDKSYIYLFDLPFSEYSPKKISWRQNRADNKNRGSHISSYLPPPCDSYGDLDNDDFVSSDDIILISNCILERETCTSEHKLRADVNQDGEVNVLDITQINRYIRGLDLTFPVCTLKVCAIPSSPTCSTGTCQCTIETCQNGWLRVRTPDNNEITKYFVSGNVEINTGSSSGTANGYISCNDDGKEYPVSIQVS